MTDNEIIKALECCIKHPYICERDCPLYESENEPCDLELMKNTLDLINSQKAEIERLEISLSNEEAQSRVMGKLYKQAKSEAIKEFAERYEKEIETSPNMNNHFRYALLRYAKQIKDNLVKEMVGDVE